MAVSLGLVLGPLIGGFLSNTDYVSWFNDSTPLYFAAILAILNIVLLYFVFHETSKVHEKVSLRFTRALEIFVSAFRHRSIRYLSICYLLFQTGWVLYYVYSSAYMTEKYGVSKTEVALFFSLVAVGMAIGLGFLSGVCEKKNIARKLVALFGYSAALVCVAITVFPNQQVWPWIVTVPIGTFVGLGYAFILAVFSEQVPDNQQGWVMGITSSLLALGAGVSSLLAGVLSPVTLKLPFYVSIALLLAGALLFVGFKTQKTSS